MTQEDLEIRRLITDIVEQTQNPDTDEVIQTVANQGYDREDVVNQLQEMERHGFLYTVGTGVKLP
jgi:hypothetical protein